MIAVALGVSFVAGTFVLGDSLKATFDNLFTRLNEKVDLEVRSELAFDEQNAQRDPVPADLAPTIAATDGVQQVEPVLQRYAQLLKPDGTALNSIGGAPQYGVAWSGLTGLYGLDLKEGRAPSGIGETAIDKVTAKRGGLEVGQQVTIVFDSGRRTFAIVGLIGLPNADGFGGATVAAFDTATAQIVLDSQGTFDAIDIKLAEGADEPAVKLAIEKILPERTEVVTGEVVAQEAADQVNQNIAVFGTGLLIFAFITAFVSAFIINNVFGITITQRLRELALLRAVGASRRQVRVLIFVEALLISVTATIVGIFGGVLIAKGLIAIFNAAGAGFPAPKLVMQGRTILVATIVGVGITLASVLIPSGRAARIPPVAAMRPEAGYPALQASKRLMRGALMTVAGLAMFLAGLFARPGGTRGLLALAGGGALLVFLGVASLSAAVAHPVTRALGWPIEKLFGVPGRLARENSGRVPRRTARTSSALMIGVALVSASAVFAASLRDTFGRIIDRSVTADYVVTDPSFQGLPPGVAIGLAELPELAAVSPIRTIFGQVSGSSKGFAAVEPVGFEQLADIGMTSGGYAGLDDAGLLLHEDPAEDLNVTVGGEVPVKFQNGVERSLKVVGIYTDAALVGNWIISIATLESVSTVPPRDFVVVAKIADGVEPANARAAIETALRPYPQAKLQSNAEFRRAQEDQINQLLVVITALLGMAIIIAIVGIAITLALSVLERTREIGLIRAVGMNRRKLRRTIRWESVIVSVFGALVGVVVGLVFGISLSLAVPDTVIDGITFPTFTVLIVLVGAVVSGVLAGWWPARRAAKMNVLEAIATE
ncbi:MAG TPA: FtsX-like permease family protein [Acidimicrobiales bacterium]